ncbi:MAG TPA: hypothetical protein VHV83_18645, partial [Armatimonadota bacterium]|nr:hypothetical protein [Armatimonadota bacterium]
MSELSPLAEIVAFFMQKRPLSRSGRLLFALILLIFVVGIAGSFIFGDINIRRARNKVVADALSVAVLADPVTVEHLKGEVSDVNTQAYKSFYTSITKLKSLNSHYRDIYLLAQRHGNIVFLLDTDTSGLVSPVPPGTPYEDSTPALRKSFAGVPTFDGPTRDKWGMWVSGLAPIRDPATKRVIAVLGIDIDASDWFLLIGYYRLLPFAIAVVLIMVLLIIVSSIHQRHMLKARALDSESKYSTVVENIR